MSDSNRAVLSYVQESVYGVTPVSPAMQLMRLTGESLGLETQTVTSQEIRDDRRTQDLVRVGINAAGNVDFELSADTYDDLLLATLLDANWSSPVNSSGATLTFVAAAGTITRAAGSWVSDGLLQHRVVRLAKVGGLNDGKVLKILSLTATVITVDIGSIVDEAAVTGYTVQQGASAVDGVTFRSYSLERQFADLSNEFSIFTGMAVSQMSLAVALNSIIKGSFTFLGKTEASATATVAGSTVARTATDVMNIIDDVRIVKEGGAQYDVTDLTLSYNNNLRARLQVGTLGAISVGLGSVLIQGTHKAYYQSKTVMNKYLNATASSLMIIFAKAGSSPLDVLVIDIPRIKYTSGRRVAGGINQDILADMAWTAIVDPTMGCTIRVTKFT